jgi:hypothetical protein
VSRTKEIHQPSKDIITIIISWTCSIDSSTGTKVDSGTKFDCYSVVLLFTGTTSTIYCMGQAIPNEKKTFYRQVLKLGANEASAQGLQNSI